LFFQQQLYFPQHERHFSIDGAFFGTSFPFLFLENFPQYTKQLVSNNLCSEKEQLLLQDTVEPKIFGFKIHASKKEDQKVQLKEQVIK
jgi:casein kinase II subunit beta